MGVAPGSGDRADDERLGACVSPEERCVDTTIDLVAGAAPSRITPTPRPTPNPKGSATTVRNRSFEEVWDCVRGKGEFRAVSTRGTEYRVTSETSRGRKVLIARPRSGAIYVHADCFGQDITCQGTRAGGIYNGHPSVWDC